MRRRLGHGWEESGESWDHDEFAQLQSGEDNLLTSLGEVVLVGVADFFDQAMRVQPFEQARYMGARAVGQDSAQARVAETADGPFAARQGEEEGDVSGIEQVEAAVAPILLARRL